ncbi:serine/threonine-protein kinase [Mitsuaria sp. GD03876]|uniref:serine/threonine-protein kinase n=1 Tax=Mitsuaria sp. GD03876 TaxID=2975399 RepID=UPI00244D28EA|nr:serine/threonine-protein kinase [Mitsuaria sp. GD03876]MDH0863752.1 serine/threonine protein kinase [Mitsuaria sp. GD03876]
MDALDKQRWIALSPLLDELLDLEEPDRGRRLAQIRAGDAAMAEHLEALLARDAVLNEDRFLEQPAAEALQGPTPSPVAALDLAGETLGPYVLERELGQGGMGAVWLARRADGRFEGQVAVKFLKSGLFGKGDSGRFEREGQILARLSDPHIARLLDAGVHHGHQPYLVLEYVDGLPIDRYCQVNGLDVESRIKLFLDVLSAVAHAHQRLILHRDLKPSNILVTHDGQVKLLDFGIAKLLDDATQSGAATELTQRAGSAFTPQYAAPEQVQQADVTTATDVYALGVLLYQMLGGRHPTADDTQTHLDRLRAVVDLVPKRLSDVARDQLDPVIARQAKLLRGDLDTIVGKALKKKPSERYANAESMAVDLRHWLAHEPITARPDTRLYVLGRFVRRHRWSVAASSAAVMVLVGLTGVSVLQARRAERAEHQAQERRQQADDLLSYMLGEFADKLRPVGRLELLDSVGSKALTYLAQDQDATPMERLQRAKALTVIGEVRVSKRNLKEALEPLEAARKLLEGAPPSGELVGEWRKAQGAAAFWVGHAHYYSRELDKATEAWLAYRDAEQAWVDAQPKNREALIELSYAYNSLGTARLDGADLRGAAEYFRRSIELKREGLALGDRSDNAARMDLADSLSWLGSVTLWQGDARAAEAMFSEGATVISAVRVGAPNEGAWSYREAIMRRWRSEALARIGRLPEAVTEARTSVDMLRKLHGQDASNVQWWVNLLLSEAGALDFEWPRLSPEGRVEQVAALRTKIEELARSQSAGVKSRLSEVWARWAWVAARTQAAAGHPALAAQTLRKMAEDQAQLVSARGADLRFASVYGDTRRRMIVTARQHGLPLPTDACREINDITMKMPSAIGVHLQITQAWVEAQSCLGSGNRDEVRRAADWAAARQSHESTP